MAKKINVLMCGGRRTGKTSIMAAMQRDMMKLFVSGSIVLTMDNANSLILYQAGMEQLFSEDNWEQVSYYAEDAETSQQEEFPCKVTFQGSYNSPVELNFIDIPGEWFVDPVYESVVQKLMSDSQVLVIAVDSPHLMEDKGRFHDVFNRPTVITDAIKKAFQAKQAARMVLFVPVKCELYRNNGRSGSSNKKNMSDLLAAVKAGYSDLLTYLCTAQKDDCTVAVSPCITMGGMEFLQFVQPQGKDGRPVEAVSVDPATGYLNMNWRSEYVFLYGADGEHFYKPEDCAQPLLYILLFFVAIGRRRNENQNILSRFIDLLRHLPNQEVLESGRKELRGQLKTDEKEGFAVLNDPMDALR